MNFTGKNLWVVEEALREAVDASTEFMDANRNHYKNDWVPAAECEEGFDLGKKRRAMFARLLKKVTAKRING
jgi:hypothetical protein